MTTAMTGLTANEAVAAIRGLGCGMTARWRDGECRVTFADLPRERAEAAAYYTDDAQDAVWTAESMLRTRRAYGAS